MFAEWIKFFKSVVWTLNHLMSKLIMKFYRHQDGWLYVPYPISSSVPSGCLYSVNQQAVNIVFQQQVYLRGTAFKQQSQLFDTSPSHLSAQPSQDVKVHLPIKHSHKTLIHPLFSLYGRSSHNYPWSHNQRLILRLRHELWVCICACVPVEVSRRGGGGGTSVWTGVVPQTWVSNNSALKKKTDRHEDVGYCCSDRELGMQTHTNRTPPHHHHHPTPPAVSLWPSLSLSLPLAVSQIPDDVLTGGLSDWR